MKRRPFVRKVLQSSGVLFLGSQLPLLYANSGIDKKKKLGIALVGLGNYSSKQLAPALLESKSCYLAGIVTGTKEKETEWSEKYSIPEQNIYNYQNFDSIVDNKEIDIVYVVLPNSMHAEYTIRAARAKKHVICEKPMATSVEDCRKMIAACKEAKRKLSIGYRLHFDPFNEKMMLLGQNKVYGQMEIESGFAFTLKNPNRWRVQKSMSGGGPLMDVGIYCLQGCIYTYGELPTSLWAKDLTKDKSFFKDIEGTIEWEMTFPSGKAYCVTSYEDRYEYLTAHTEKGTLKLSPAFIYNGLEGSTPDGPMNIKPINQQAAQMDAFARNILEDTESLVPGEMGLRDNYIIEKIYESASRNGAIIDLKDIPKILDLRNN